MKQDSVEFYRSQDRILEGRFPLGAAFLGAALEFCLSRITRGVVGAGWDPWLLFWARLVA